MRPRERVAVSTQSDTLELLTLDEADAVTADQDGRAIAAWVRAYLMRPHAELGRPGHVCPFTSRSAKLALLRIGVSHAGAGEMAGVVATMREAMRAFDGLACERANRIFRTVIVTFPRCAGPDGIATLRAAQNALRHHSILGGRMIGLFEPRSEAEGLLNPAFRPLRAPVPTLAIRMLVEQDAPFVVRNPLLLPIYLAKFPRAGSRRLWRLARPMTVS